MKRVINKSIKHLFEKENKEKHITENEILIKQAYKRGYNLGFRNSERLKRRLLKIKLLIREVWRILSMMKNNEK